MDNNDNGNYVLAFVAVFLNIFAGFTQSDWSFAIGAIVAVLAVIDKTLSIQNRLRERKKNKP